MLDAHALTQSRTAAWSGEVLAEALLEPSSSAMFTERPVSGAAAVHCVRSLR